MQFNLIRIFTLCFILASGSGASAQPAHSVPAKVRLLNGEAVSGSLDSIDDEAITLSDRELPRSEVRSVQLTDAKSAKPDPIAIGLVDRSVIRSPELTMQDDRWQLGGVWANQAIGPKQTSFVLFRSPSESEAADWSRILKSDRSSDSLVILRTGGVIDQINGLVLSITSDAVEFDFDGQTISAPRAKLLGIVMYRQTPERLKPTPIVELTNGSRINVSPIQLPAADSNSTWKLMTSKGTTLDAPVASVANIDFASANLRWASEVELLDRRLLTQSLGLRSNNGPDFGADELLLPGFVIRKNAVALAGTSAADSDLVFPVPGEYTLRVPEGFSRFSATVERSVSGKVASPVTVRIEQDGEELFSDKFDSDTKSIDISIDVISQKRTSLIVETTNKLAAGSATTWKQPRFSR